MVIGTVSSFCESKQREKLPIYFLNGYNGEYVELIINDKLIYGKRIYTDESIGLADYCYISNKSGLCNIKIKLNRVNVFKMLVDLDDKRIKALGFSKYKNSVLNELFIDNKPLFD